MNRSRNEGKLVLQDKIKLIRKEYDIFAYFKTTGFAWNLWVFLLDVYCFIAYMIWISLSQYPQGIQNAIETIIELTYIINLILIIMFNSKQNNKDYYFFRQISFREVNSAISAIIMIASSLPIQFTLQLIQGSQGVDFSSYDDDSQLLPTIVILLYLLKLLRYYNIQRFLNKFENLIKYLDFNKLIFFRIARIFFWLLITNHFLACYFVFFNYYITMGYFNKTNYDETSGFMKYQTGLQWAVEAMIGSSFGDVVPTTECEIIFTLIAMVTGSVFYCKIFSDLERKIQINQQFSLDIKQRQEQVQLYANQRQIPYRIWNKMQHFFHSFQDGHKIKLYYDIVYELPHQLEIEVSLDYNQHLIQTVQIFNLGSPQFVQGIIKKLYPRVAIQYDYLTRPGELAEEFFIISKGKVEIIATDKKTIIGILEEGAYFGEVGILLSNYRSCYVRAMTDCIFMCISKDNFLSIINEFPDMKNFLLKVAQQRYKVTKPEDVSQAPLPYKSYQDEDENIEFQNLTYMRLSTKGLIVQRKKSLNQNNDKGQKANLSSVSLSENQLNESDDYLSQEDIDHKESLESPFDYNLYKKIEKHRQIYGFKIIFANENLILIWCSILLSAIFYNLFYCIFTICFYTDLDGWFMIFLEVLSFLIYAADSFIVSRLSSYNKRTQSFNQDQEYIFLQYVNSHLMLDIFSTVPFSNIYDIIVNGENTSNSRTFVRALRLLKLIKFQRFYFYINKLKTEYNKEYKYLTFLYLFFGYFFLNHLAASIMYSICKFEYEASIYYDSQGNKQFSFKTLFQQMDLNSIPSMTPVISKGFFSLYVNFLYWSFCVSTQGSYGDFWAVSPLEKTFQNYANIGFKIFISFLFAQIAHLGLIEKNMFATHMEKIESFKHWSKQIGLSKDVKKRINNFYSYEWIKLRGIEDEDLSSSYLPDTIKDQILMNELRFIISLVNPRYKIEYEGVIIQFIKQLTKLLIPQDEFVFLKGDLAQEMYFVADGTAQVLVTEINKSRVLAELHKNSYFGGLELIREQPSIRQASVKAKTNICLYVLSLNDYLNFKEYYPIAKEFLENLYPRTYDINEDYQESYFERDQFSKTKTMKLDQNNQGPNKSFHKFRSLNNFKGQNQENLGEDGLSCVINIDDNEVLSVYPNNKQILINSNLIKSNLIYREAIMSIVQVISQKRESKKDQNKYDIYSFNNQIQKDEQNHTDLNEQKKNTGNDNNIFFSKKDDLEYNQVKENAQKLKIESNSSLKLQNSTHRGHQEIENYQINLHNEKSKLAQNNLQNNSQNHFLMQSNQQSLYIFPDSTQSNFDLASQRMTPKTIIERFDFENKLQNKVISPTSISDRRDNLTKEQQTQLNEMINFSNQIIFNQNNQISSNRKLQSESEIEINSDFDNLSFDPSELNCKEEMIQEDVKKHFDSESLSQIEQEQDNSIQEQQESNIEFNQILWQLDKLINNSIFIQEEEENNNESYCDTQHFQFNHSNNLVQFDEHEDDQVIQLEKGNMISESDIQKNMITIPEAQIEKQEIGEYQSTHTIQIPTEDNQKPQIDYDEYIYEYNSFDHNIDYTQFDFDLSEEKTQQKIKKMNLINFQESYLALKKFLTHCKHSTFQTLQRLYNNFKKLEYQVSFAQYYYTILIPLYLAYSDISFRNPILITIEALILFIELRNLNKSRIILNSINQELDLLKLADDCILQKGFNQYDKEEDRMKRQNHLQDRAIYRKFLIGYQIVQAIPFSLLFDLCQLQDRRTDYFLIIIQMLRCISFTRMFNILSPIRKKNIYLTKVIEIILTYIFMNHVFCCILIVLGNMEPNFNNSWLVKLPAPQPDYPNNYRATLDISNASIYIHATYWSYVTCSHVGVGDVTGVNVRERAYSIIIMFFTTFLHLYVFGNIATIAKDATFILKKNLDEKYQQVMFTVKNIDLHRFQIQIEAYFNFIWNDFLGLDENEVIKKLPHVLKIEFFRKKYSQSLKASSLFKLNGWQRDSSIESQLLRFMHTKIYLPSDMIAQAGQTYQDLYILLQGRVEAFQFNGIKAYDFQIGDFFGGFIDGNFPLSCYLQAQIICNVGIIPQESLKHIKMVFPDWYSKIMSIQKRNNQEWLYSLNFFQKQLPEDRILFTHDNKFIKYEVTQELMNHYKAVTANFLELEVIEKKKETKIQKDANMDLFNDFNLIDQDDDEQEEEEDVEKEKEGDSQDKDKFNQMQKSQKKQKKNVQKQSNLLNSLRQSIRKNTFYQNYIGYVEQGEDKSTKSEKYKNLFIISNPYGYEQGNQIKKMNMIILNWKYVYRIFLLFDSKFDYFLHPTSNAFYQLQWMSMIFSIYSIIFTPIYICYEIELNNYIFFFEVLSAFQLVVQLYIDIKTPFYIQGTLVTDTKKIIAYMWKSKNLLQRFIHLLPLNLILWSYSLDNKDNLILYSVLSLVRGVRSVYLFEVNNILQRISQLNKTQQKLFGIFQSVLYLVTCWHYISCIWFWFVSNISQRFVPASNWILANTLYDAQLNEKIINSMFFVMSIATTCGYPSMKANNDYERVFFFLTIYFGDAFIAYGFGKLASQSELLAEVQQEIHSKIMQFRILLSEIYDSKNKTHDQRNRRIEHYYLYKSTTQVYAETDLLQIKPLIPYTLYEQLMLTSKMKFLQNIPILFKLTKSVYYKEIAQYIERKVFLQNDYINVKNNTDSDLYFISKGTVKVLSPKEDSILLTLKEGDVFSSITMNKDNKLRLCNTFSSNFTEVVTIKLEHTQRLFQLFPELKVEIVQQTTKQGKKKGYTLNLISNLVNYTDTKIGQLGLKRVESILSCFKPKSQLKPELRIGLTNLRKQIIAINNQNQQNSNSSKRNSILSRNGSQKGRYQLNNSTLTPTLKQNQQDTENQETTNKSLIIEADQNNFLRPQNHQVQRKSIFSKRNSVFSNLNQEENLNNSIDANSNKNNYSPRNNPVQETNQNQEDNLLSFSKKAILPPLKASPSHISKFKNLILKKQDTDPQSKKQEETFTDHLSPNLNASQDFSPNLDKQKNQQEDSMLKSQVLKLSSPGQSGVSKLRNLFLKREIIPENQNPALQKEKISQQIANSKKQSKFFQLLEKIDERRKGLSEIQSPDFGLQNLSKSKRKKQLLSDNDEEEEETKSLLEESFLSYQGNQLYYSTEGSQENVSSNSDKDETEEEDEFKKAINKIKFKGGQNPPKRFNFRKKYIQKQKNVSPLNKYAQLYSKLSKNNPKQPKVKSIKQQNNEIFNKKKIYLLFSKNKNFKIVKLNNDQADSNAFLSDSEIVQENENNFNIPTYGSRRMVIGNHKIQRRYSRIGLSKMTQLSLLSNSSLRWGSQLINQAYEYNSKKTNNFDN
ncbi:hypothetical protein ABPG74_018152 [Tetrahymena malaccensis]